MTKFNITANLDLKTTGVGKAERDTGKIADNLGAAAASAATMDKKLSDTAVGSRLLNEQKGLDKATHRGYRGAAGTRNAAGRNFSGLASAAGDTNTFVAAYATLAANIFALTAAFQRLSDAAKFENLKKGLEVIGATSGTTLKNTADGLKEVTGQAISTAEALRSVAQAASAGLSGDEIEGLGKVAKGASIALGRDMSDSLDRLTRGAIKLEPELLDELGIMVRLDQAAREYALQNNKVASSLTLTERRQAFLNAILDEGLTKFGELAEEAGANPYDKFLASLKEMGTGVLVTINQVVEPLLKIITEVPALALLPLMLVFKEAASKILPTFSSSLQKATKAIDNQSARVDYLKDRLREVYDEQQSSADYLKKNRWLVEGIGPNVSAATANPDYITEKSSKAAILEINKEIARVEAQRINNAGQLSAYQEYYVRKLQSTKESLQEIVSDETKLNILLTKRRNAGTIGAVQRGQRSAIEQYQKDLVTDDLFSATTKALGSVFETASYGMGRVSREGNTLKERVNQLTTRIKIMGQTTVSVARIMSIAFINAISIAMSMYAAFQLAVQAFKFLTETEASRNIKKLRESLSNVNENAAEITRQMDKAFTNRDYGKAFEPAITNLKEIVGLLKEIEEARLDITPNRFQVFSSDLESIFKDSLKNAFGSKDIKTRLATLLSPGGSFGLALGKRQAEGFRAIADTPEEAKAIETALMRIKALKGEEYALELKANLTKANKVELLNDELKSVSAIEKSWSSISEESKNAAKAISKFYGKALSESAYSDLANTFTSIKTEVEAINSAFDAGSEQSSMALSGVFKSMTDGGKEFFREMDLLAGDSSTYYVTKFEEADRISREIRLLEMQKGGVEQKARIEELAQQEIEINREVVAQILKDRIALQAQLKNLEILSIEKRQEYLGTSMKILEAEKEIAAQLTSQADMRRTADRYRAFGRDNRTEAEKLDSQIEKEKVNLDFKMKTLSIQAELLDLEFKLQKSKLEALRREEQNKLDALNGVQSTSSGTTWQGVDFMPYISNNIDNAVVASYKDFTSYIKRDFADLTEEQTVALWKYALVAKSLDAHITSGSKVVELQKLTNDLVAQESAMRIKLLEDQKAGYNSIYRINERSLAIQEKELASHRKVTDELNKQAMNAISIEEARRDTIAAQRNRPLGELEIAGRGVNRAFADLQAARQARSDAQASQRSMIEGLGNAVDEAFAKLELTDGAIARQQAQEEYNAAVLAFTNASVENAAALATLQSNVDLAAANFAKLNAQLPSMEKVLDTRMRTAGEGRELAISGFGASIGGFGSEFSDLVSTKSAIEGTSISEILKNPDTVKKLRDSAAEIKFLNIQAEGLNNIANTIGSSFSDAFGSIIDGTKSAKQAFGEMAISILKSISEMIIKMMVLRMVSSFLGVPTAGPAGGVGAGSNLHTGVSVASVSGNNPVPGLADGGIMPRGVHGIVNEPTYLVGEGKHNEAVVPLPNGRAIPVQMHGSGGSNQVQVNVNLDNNGNGNTQITGDDASNLGVSIAAAVQKQLMEEKRPGGLLNKYGAS